MNEHDPNEHARQIHEYAQHHIQQGVHPAHVRQSLVDAGWHPGFIDGIMQYFMPHHQGIPAGPQQTDHQPDAPQKYKVFRSVADTCRAFRANALNIILGIVVSFGLGIGLQVILVLVTASSVLATGYVLSFLGAVVAGILLQAFLVSILAGGFYAGAEGRREPFGTLFRNSLKKIFRMVGATSLAAVIMLGPYLVLMAAAFLLSFTLGDLWLLLMVASVVGLAWLIVASFNYALTPYVALFEPGLPISKTPGRSKYLLARGGRWFLFKSYLLLLLAVVLLAVLSGTTVEDLQDSTSALTNILAYIIVVFSIGCLTMLYRNRRSVRGQTDPRS